MIHKMLTEDEAIEFHYSKKWMNMSALELAHFQINQTHLCMPFNTFLKAVEETIGEGEAIHPIALLVPDVKRRINEIYEESEKQK
jgi:hypothetical protein